MIWIAYALATSLLLGCAAAMLERALRAARRPGRWAWLAALTGSATLLAAALSGRPLVRLPLAENALVDRALAPVAPLVSAGSSGAALAGRLWVAASALVLLLLAAESLRIHLRSRYWRPARIAGQRVLVSRADGPATWGVWRTHVVVPLWVLELGVRARRLIMLHEQEHRRAGDVRLLLVGALLVAAVPWNPLLWWQLGRMHRALELDCDARVVRRTRDRAAYGRVLLEAGSRSRAGHPLLAGFALRRSLLERRIEALFPARRARVWPALASIAAVIALVVACAVPAPTEPAPAGAVSTYRFTPDAAGAGIVRPRAAGRVARFGAVGTIRQREPSVPGEDAAAPASDGGVARLRERSPGEVGAAGVVRRTSAGAATASGVLRARQRPEPQ